MDGAIAELLYAETDSEQVKRLEGIEQRHSPFGAGASSAALGVSPVPHVAERKHPIDLLYLW